MHIKARYLFVGVALVFTLLAQAQEPVTGRFQDELTWSPLTFAMCLAGWFISLTSDWATKWNTLRVNFSSYLQDHLPRVIIGFVSVLACYVLIPELILLFQLDIKLNNLGAFVTGLSADVIVHRIRGLIPRSADQREVERQKVVERAQQGAARETSSRPKS